MASDSPSGRYRDSGSLQAKLLTGAALLGSAALLVLALWVAGGSAPLKPGFLDGGAGGSSGQGRGGTQARLDALESRLDRISMQLERIADNQPGSSRTAPPQQEHEPSQAELEHAARAQRAALATEFEGERVDPRWAAGAETELRRVGSTDAILAIEAKPPRRQSIDCRSTRCRLTFDFSEAADAEDWTVAFLTSTGATLKRSTYFVDRKDDGSATITLYGER